MSIRRTTTIGRTASRSVASKNQSEQSLLTDLFTAYYCARKNKRNTASQVRFERNLSDNLINLYEEIASGRYKVGRSMCFIIKDPVLREVFAASFRDRIVHHLLYNWLMPIFEPTFIYDSYSCREGKGTLFGIERMEHHIRSCSDNYTKDCYVMKLDIEGYFMNINRQVLFDIIVRRLKDYESTQDVRFDINLAIDLLYQVIFNDPVKGCYRKGHKSDWNRLPKSKSLFYSPEGCGLPIGNLTSQLFSNIYLSSFDHYVKRVLRFKHYGRYVDDFYIVGNSKKSLLEAIPKIKDFLSAKLYLRLHPRKVYIAPIHKGVRFLGSVVKPYQRYVYCGCLSRAHSHINDALTYAADPFFIIAVLQSYSGYYAHFLTKNKLIALPHKSLPSSTL